MGEWLRDTPRPCPPTVAKRHKHLYQRTKVCRYKLVHLQNLVSAMKMDSKTRVEFVSTSWMQPCPYLGPIIPETRNPKNKDKTLIMVDLAIGQINKIK